MFWQTQRWRHDLVNSSQNALCHSASQNWVKIWVTWIDWYKNRKVGMVIWFLSVQFSIKKAECVIVCMLPTLLPKQSALLLLANMYLANIYNFISYLPVLLNLSVSVIRSKGFGRQNCHQEALKTAPQTQQLNKYSIFWPKKYLTHFSEWRFTRRHQPPKLQNIAYQVL